MKKQIVIAAMVVHGLLVGQSANAAGAMTVDDAQVLEAKKCQVETWGAFYREGTERVLGPACNFTGNLEIGWGNAWQRDARGMYLASSQLQGKTVFKELSPNGYGIGMLGGVVRQTDSDDEEGEGERVRSWNYFAKLLTSFSLKDDEVLLHANLGFNRSGSEHATRLTWGFANETRLMERLSFIGEVFGEDKGKPSYQAGVRMKLVPEHVEMDLTYSNTFGRETQDRYFVVGLRFITPELWR